MRIFRDILLLFLLAIVSGCSLINSSHINSPETNEALNILKKIESINKDIKTSKGTGWLTITDIKMANNDLILLDEKLLDDEQLEDEQLEYEQQQKSFGGQKSKRFQSKKFRMAWAASFPDKIRLTLLSAGHPVETILADGKSVTFISHTGKHKTKKINSANPSLKDIVSIPVTIQDILSIFAGRVPIISYDSANIAQITYSSELTDTMLILKQRWNGNSQNIVLSHDNQISSFSLLNENRKLIHSVFNEHYKMFDSFSIPSKVKIRDNEGRVIDFIITNYQPNIFIKQDMFVLTE